MIDINSLTSTVITLFIIVVISFIATKAKLINESFTKGLSNFIIFVAQPFMIMSSLSEVEFSFANLKNGFLIVGIGLILMAVTALTAKLFIAKFKSLDEKKIGQFGLIFANVGFMGIPVLKSAFGSIGGFYGAFFQVTFNLVLWTYGMIILAKGRTDIKVKPLNMLLNFGTIPVIIGVILYVLPFDLPYPVERVMSILSSMCAPGSMIIVGSIIAGITFKELFLDLKIYYLSAIKLALLPIIICVLTAIAGLSEEYVLVFTILFALPTATNTAMYAQKYDITPSFGAKLCSITTVFSVATLPLVISLARLLASAL